jgi:hypothetical protein
MMHIASCANLSFGTILVARLIIFDLSKDKIIIVGMLIEITDRAILE